MVGHTHENERPTWNWKTCESRSNLVNRGRHQDPSDVSKKHKQPERRGRADAASDVRTAVSTATGHSSQHSLSLALRGPSASIMAPKMDAAEAREAGLRAMGELKEKLEENMGKVVELFHEWDTNDDGKCSKTEFGKGLKKTGRSTRIRSTCSSSTLTRMEKDRSNTTSSRRRCAPSARPRGGQRPS